MIAYILDDFNEIIALVGKFESKKAGHRYIDTNFGSNVRRRFVKL